MQHLYLFANNITHHFYTVTAAAHINKKCFLHLKKIGDLQSLSRVPNATGKP